MGGIRTSLTLSSLTNKCPLELECSRFRLERRQEKSVKCFRREGGKEEAKEPRSQESGAKESGDDDPIEAMVDKEQQLTEKLFEQFHGNLTLLRNWRTT